MKDAPRLGPGKEARGRNVTGRRIELECHGDGAGLDGFAAEVSSAAQGRDATAKVTGFLTGVFSRRLGHFFVIPAEAGIQD
jgi:hypothetical protein